MRLTAAVALLGAVQVGVAGCGGGGGGGDAPGRSEATTLRIGEFSWSAAALTNTIFEQLVARHPELGITRVERVKTGPQKGWEELAEGELDVLTEVYIPNQARFAEEARDEARLVHRTYSGAVNGWFVPRYAVRQGGPAAGLRSIDQLNRYADVFGRKLYDGERGWVSTQQNADRIEGFALRLQHVTGSERELLAELKRRYRAKQPILLYLWRPHWAHSAFDLVELEAPNPYSSDCFTDVKQACAMPTDDVWIAAGKDLARRAPRLWRLLNHVEIPIEEMEAMLVEIDGKGTPPSTVARRWVVRNAREIERWLRA